MQLDRLPRFERDADSRPLRASLESALRYALSVETLPRLESRHTVPSTPMTTALTATIKGRLDRRAFIAAGSAGLSIGVSADASTSHPQRSNTSRVDEADAHSRPAASITVPSANATRRPNVVTFPFRDHRCAVARERAMEIHLELERRVPLPRLEHRMHGASKCGSQQRCSVAAVHRADRVVHVLVRRSREHYAAFFDALNVQPQRCAHAAAARSRSGKRAHLFEARRWRRGDRLSGHVCALKGKPKRSRIDVAKSRARRRAMRQTTPDPRSHARAKSRRPSPR
jgi:hypothetical protein